MKKSNFWKSYGFLILMLTGLEQQFVNQMVNIL